MAAGDQTLRRRLARVWLLRLSLVAALGVGGCLLGLRMAGPSVRDTALGTVSLRVEIVSIPPSGIASRAFTARLITTCASWPGSART